MHRRRLLQMAALAPAAPLLPSLTGLVNAAEGEAVGAGLVLDGADLAGISLSWKGVPHGTSAVVRALVDGVWGDPIAVEADHGHGPDDPAGREHGPAILVPGASAYWVQPGDGADHRVHRLSPPPRRLDLLADPTVTEPIPGLLIHDRSNWTDVSRKDTIDCTLRSSVLGLGCRSDVGLRHAVIHHTVNPNDYSQADVPGMLYGIQQYHVGTRGWDDIGYNFVIDRFGRIWHAREGDIHEPITSGHTKGFNAESVGVAVLGNFSEASVPDAVVVSLGLLIGWKLSLHGVDPLGHTLVRSSGGDITEAGEMVDVDNVSGHRDNQQTSCPGTFLYNRVSEVKTAAAELVPIFGHVTPTYSLDDVRVKGWAIERFRPDVAAKVDLIVDGGDPIPLTTDLEEPGLSGDYPDAGPNHGFDVTVPIDLDTTSIVVRAVSADGRGADLMDLTLFATFIDVEPDRFFAPGVYYLRRKNLTTGTKPGLFEPMNEVTRGQMATFLHRFMDLQPYDRESPFEDLADGAFYLDAVHWLHQSGITTGTSPTTFSPEDVVTRGQMATFLWRMCGEPAPPVGATFADVDSGAFYGTAVSWMADLGITTGTSPTTFSPDGEITRGEMATFLQRLGTTPEAWTLVTPPTAVDL